MGEGNAAVQAVGKTFFRVTIVGYIIAGLAMFPAVIFGTSKHFFRYELDRCSCVPVSDLETEICMVGHDKVTVDIGWKSFTFVDWNNTAGCPDATKLYNEDSKSLQEQLDNPQSPGAFDKVYPLDGVFQKSKNPTQADEDNGGAEAGGGVVAMSVICTFFCIITYKMLKASFLTNGSHCSIGLGLMTRLNTMVCIGLAASLVSFWWLIEGRFGDNDKALTQALENTIFNECWVEEADQLDCSLRPWEFTGPRWALWVAILQAVVYSLSTLYMMWKAPLVEGVLDGSMDKEGVMLKPRVVEVEMVVGKALATDGDPDYDSENPLYNGAATMIRPYPLPKSAKAAKSVIEAEEAVAVGAPQGAVVQDSAASNEYETKSDPEMAEDQISAMHSEYNGPADLEMIVEESEEDRTSSRYSETRYSEASRYSDTYSDYGDRPTRAAQGGGASRGQAAPIR